MRRRDFLAAAAAAPSAGANIAADRHRPQYHFLPPKNWMNDPNGPIWWKGRHHLFYQHNPNGAFWGDMHWGHASSPDLLHWTHLPIALAPTPGGPDKDGVFTGCAVVHENKPTLIYTGVQPEVQCIATSEDRMIEWKKHPANPIIAAPPAGLQVTGFRDPCVWKQDGTWWMVIGAGFKGIGGTALLYRSDDLVRWIYLHPLYTGKLDPNAKAKGAVATGEMWECPEFFPLGRKWVLIVSAKGTTPYFVGEYRGLKFEPESEGVIDAGAYYAPKSYLDNRGRRILWGWIQERRSREAQIAAGWSGVMSLARVLTLDSQARLEMEPAPEYRKLRAGHATSGDSLELEAVFELTGTDDVGLTVAQTRIAYRLNERRLVAGPNSTLLALDPGEKLRLRVFVDGSVIEVFANRRAPITVRHYPDAGQAVSVSAIGRPFSFESWRMKSISKDRLTS